MSYREVLKKTIHEQEERIKRITIEKMELRNRLSKLDNELQGLMGNVEFEKEQLTILENRIDKEG